MHAPCSPIRRRMPVRSVSEAMRAANASAGSPPGGRPPPHDSPDPSPGCPPPHRPHGVPPGRPRDSPGRHRRQRAARSRHSPQEPRSSPRHPTGSSAGPGGSGPARTDNSRTGNEVPRRKDSRRSPTSQAPASATANPLSPRCDSGAATNCSSSPAPPRKSEVDIHTAVQWRSSPRPRGHDLVVSGTRRPPRRNGPPAPPADGVRGPPR
jgi:hypothetical protein